MPSYSLPQMARRLRGTPIHEARLTLKDKALALRLCKTFERDLELAHVRGVHFYVAFEL